MWTISNKHQAYTRALSKLQRRRRDMRFYLYKSISPLPPYCLLLLLYPPTVCSCCLLLLLSAPIVPCSSCLFSPSASAATSPRHPQQMPPAGRAACLLGGVCASACAATYAFYGEAGGTSHGSSMRSLGEWRVSGWVVGEGVWC